MKFINFIYHIRYFFKIIEIKNKNLVSCSVDPSIIFYYKDNLKTTIKYDKWLMLFCYRAKENEICYSEYKNNTICFYDLLEKK